MVDSAAITNFVVEDKIGKLPENPIENKKWG